MTKETVKAIVAKELSDCKVEIQESLQENDTPCTHLVISKAGDVASPSFRPEKFHPEMTDEEVANYILHVYRENHISNLFSNEEIEKIKVFDGAKDRILPRVVGKSASEFILHNYPHRDFLDLAIIYTVWMDSTGEKTIKVSQSLMEMWGVSEETLYASATANVNRIAPSKRRSLTSIYASMGFPVEKMEEPFAEPFEIIYTDRPYGAASAFLDTRACKEFAKTYSMDSFLVVPSSIHEVLAIKEEMKVDGLRGIVHEVNDEYVLPYEVLSGNVYRYHLNTDSFSVEGKEAA